LDNVFVFQNALRNVELPQISILDLTDVPYLDSAGMGAIVNYYVHCQRKGAQAIVAGVNGRAMELFVLSKVHTIIPMADSVEEAQERI
jgi:anti-anti-sigma factor